MEEIKIKQECEYNPCHDGLEDCTFCYCPIYPCDIEKTGGTWILRKSDNTYLWDCSKCTLVHTEKFIIPLKKYFTKLVKKLSR